VFESSFWMFIRLLISLPIVLILAYYGTKFILSRQLISNGNRTRTMRVVDRIQLGPKTFVSIVEINKCYYLLSSNENSTSLLKELPDYEPPELQENGFESRLEGLKFPEILEKQVVKLKNKLRGDKGNGNWNK